MRRTAIAIAAFTVVGAGGTAVVTTTHAAGLPLPIVGGLAGGGGLPVVGSLPGLGGGMDPVGTVVGTLGGLPGFVLNCGLAANVPLMQHPAKATKKTKKTKHTAPSMPTCSNGLPIVSQLPVVGGIAGGLPTGGLGGLTGGLPVVGDGSGLGGLDRRPRRHRRPRRRPSDRQPRRPPRRPAARRPRRAHRGPRPAAAAASAASAARRPGPRRSRASLLRLVGGRPAALRSARQ